MARTGFLFGEKFLRFALLAASSAVRAREEVRTGLPVPHECWAPLRFGAIWRQKLRDERRTCRRRAWLQERRLYFLEKSGLLLRCKLERDDAHEALEGSRAFEIFGLSAEQRYPTGGVVLLTSMVLPDAVFLCVPGAVVLKRYGVLRPIEVGRHGPVLGEPVDVLRPAERLVVLEGGEGGAAQACWEAHSHGKQALGGGGRAGRHESGRPSRLTHPACARNFDKRLFEFECRTEGVNAPRAVSSRGIGRVPPVGAAEL